MGTPDSDPRVERAHEKYTAAIRSAQSAQDTLRGALDVLDQAIKSYDDELHGFDDNSMGRIASTAGFAATAAAIVATGGAAAVAAAGAAALSVIVNEMDQAGDLKSARAQIDLTKNNVDLALNAFLEAVDRVTEAAENFENEVDTWAEEQQESVSFENRQTDAEPTSREIDTGNAPMPAWDATTRGGSASASNRNESVALEWDATGGGNGGDGASTRNESVAAEWDATGGGSNGDWDTSDGNTSDGGQE